ncbi:hypothetical protein [Clostridium sp. SHJSY1]|uniref:hypothetical protein n=1 Tax=Clostridium sp. SHJSY1 TaxID=2942483 RepID=UPI00287BA5C1|nr:hypothetical protein [Clostridium sp. SHJSY1]
MSIGKASSGYIFGVVYEYGNGYMIFMISTLAFIIAIILLFKIRCFDNMNIKRE